MGVLLASERQTAKGRIFLAIVYAVLALGGLTMVLPFLIMLASSISGPYDYNRHAPVVRAIWDRSDRFMRSLATYFPRFPREIYPDAPESWGSWTTVARDTDGIAAFAAQHLEPAWTNLDVRAEWKRRAEAFRDRTLAWDIDYTTCSYDARDVAPFVKSQISLDELNRTWPVRYRSFFDISFTAESKIPLGHASWKPPKDDPKYAMWCAFKDHYRQRMVADGDYICRTLPFPLTGGSRSCATETGGSRSCATDIRAALATQFIEHGRRDFWRSAFANYRLVADYLFVRGRAFLNTLILVLLTVLAHLTVNPLAAYALSRFHMRGTEKILLFLLATMAFPAAVTAIPGFLLVRDLGLLNTFAALVLPTVASGMSIFILKGFFDALPRELYEAAAIDGASEWLVFRKITLPMTTPILAVQRAQQLPRRLQLMGVGVPRVPEGVALDACRVDVPDEPAVRGTALVRDGRLRARVHPHRRRLPRLPEGHPPRHRPPIDEMTPGAVVTSGAGRLGSRRGSRPCPCGTGRGRGCRRASKLRADADFARPRSRRARRGA